FEDLDQCQSLRRRLRILDPGRRVSNWFVEFLEPGAIVAEVRPAHAVELRAHNQVLYVRGWLRGTEASQSRDEKDDPVRKTCSSNDMHFRFLVLYCIIRQA